MKFKLCLCSALLAAKTEKKNPALPREKQSKIKGETQKGVKKMK